MEPEMRPAMPPDDTGLLASPRPGPEPFPRPMPKLSPRLLVGMEAGEAWGWVMALGGEAEAAEEPGWWRPEEVEAEEGFLGRWCCCVEGWGGCCVALL